jgi:hypothetical protein
MHGQHRRQGAKVDCEPLCSKRLMLARLRSDFMAIRKGWRYKVCVTWLKSSHPRVHPGLVEARRHHFFACVADFTGVRK